MSDYRAIAGVSATLKALLEDRMTLTNPDLGPGERVTVSISHPDVKPAETPQGPRLNLFLLEIAQNAHLRNQDYPADRGIDYGKPPLALNLSYLLTCFPVQPEDDLTAHAVLGDALQVLHEDPVIAKELVRTRGLGAGEPVLHPSLQGEVEPIKLMFHAQPREALDKLWTALREPYRLSVPFTVSVVRIESRKGRAESPPVLRRQVQTAAVQIPQVLRVEPERAPVGHMVIIHGANLAIPDLIVRFGEVQAEPVKMAANELLVAVPDDGRLRPGPLPLTVRSGAAEGATAGLQSNAASFLLVPRIQGATVDSGRLQLTGSKLYDPDQPCRVVIGGQSREPDLTTATEASIAVSLDGIAAGTHAIRVRVGVAESLDQIHVTIP